MSGEKIIQFANFNITFGDEAEAMLHHFEDVVYPALTAKFVKVENRDKDNEIRYSFTDVSVKNACGEYVLVGNIVKEMNYSVRTIMQGSELISHSETIPTAPYSRFIVFLKNHRMILIKNEKISPTLSNFQKMVGYAITRLTLERNKKKNETMIPKATVNIVGIPSNQEINTVLKNVKKIESLNIHYYPLNNDIDFCSMSNEFREQMKLVGSDTSYIRYNSPKSKEGVKSILQNVHGLARIVLKTIGKDGIKRSIEDESFSAKQTIPYTGNLEGTDDEKIINQVINNPEISITSKENEMAYKRNQDKLERLAEK
jgi:hypothetical protein